jgi:hypothetical protein
LQVKFQLTKEGPGKVVNINQEFDFTLTAAVLAGKPTSLTLTDTPPAGSGIKFLGATPATCDVTETLLSCVMTGSFPQTVKLTAIGTVAGTFENVALLTGPGNSSTGTGTVTVFQQTCGEVTPGGGAYDKCLAGYSYDARFAGKSPANNINCCVSC